MLNQLRAVWNDDSGQDLAEYALLFALIAIVAIASLIVIGGGINGVFTEVGNEIANEIV